MAWSRRHALRTLVESIAVGGAVVGASSTTNPFWRKEREDNYRERLAANLEKCGAIDDDGTGELGMVLSIGNLVAVIQAVIDAREGK